MTDIRIFDFLAQFKKEQGVYLACETPEMVQFEQSYLKVRQKENRLLSDVEVSQLPCLKNHPHSSEWQKRAKSAQRINNYFAELWEGKVLDLGCGNGWFTAMMAGNERLEVVGMDVNLTELKQAARVFQKPNLHFVYGDIFSAGFAGNCFDFIILNAAIQYFSDIDKLINRLFDLLRKNGEIHFIDSPIYNKDQASAAKQRTVDYFSDLGFPEMSRFYYHHSWPDIQNRDYEVLYAIKKIDKLLRFVKKSDMPFPWIKLVKRNGKDQK